MYVSFIFFLFFLSQPNRQFNYNLRIFSSVGASKCHEADLETDPYFYIPRSELKKDVLKLLPEQEKQSPDTKRFYLAQLTAGTQSTSRVLLFQTPALNDLVRYTLSPSPPLLLSSSPPAHHFPRIEHSAITWFSEDERLLGPHPKDPYKRIETLPSSRKIRIEVEGVVVAESSQNVFLFETMLRPRYYLNPGSVKWDLLEESQTISYCPYKGMAKCVPPFLPFLFDNFGSL